VAIVPEIKLGIFITSTNGGKLSCKLIPVILTFVCWKMSDADDSTESIFTQPAMKNYLLPAFLAVLWREQETPPLPANYKTFTGLYRLSDSIFNTIDWQVFEDHGVLYASYVVGDYYVGVLVGSCSILY
jgi:hypothetical protein